MFCRGQQVFTSSDIQAHGAVIAEGAESNAAAIPLGKGVAALIAIANGGMGRVLREILSLHIEAHVVMAGASFIVRAQSEAFTAPSAGSKADVGIACSADHVSLVK